MSEEENEQKEDHIATYQYTHLFVAHYWCQGCHNPFEVTEIF